MEIRQMTVAQAIVEYLSKQFVERDAKRHQFICGMWGIFGHGNVAGLGQALETNPVISYYQARNEQAMVHAAVAFAKQRRRLQTFACTSSIGPGASNMVTAAALATINRLPVLLLPGDVFAKRQRGPVLQQLESPLGPDISVNDCFKPVSRFWDRIYRWEQVLESLPEAIRVLSSNVETGCVTICLPQDVQVEVGSFPISFFEPRTQVISRQMPDLSAINAAVNLINKAQRPLLIAGGGVNYSEAEQVLAELCRSTGLPCSETQAGKGALSFVHEQNLGAIGVTGTSAANHIARTADLVIAIGTRLSDFTTGSGTQFNNQDVKFIGLNIDPRDAAKYSALSLVGDCRATLQELQRRLVETSYRISPFYQEELANSRAKWMKIRSSYCYPEQGESLSQAEVLGTLNEQLALEDTVVAAAGSLPGDMHKLTHVHSSLQYHMEYGYSCMGYEIAGGLGVRFAKDKGDVFVLVGDGSYLMMHTEIVTSLQENKKLIIVVFVNHKFASIDRLSRSCGSRGFGNEFRFRGKDGFLSGSNVEVDYVKNAESLGANGALVKTREDLAGVLKEARASDKTFLIAVELDPTSSVPSFDTYWEVPKVCN